MNSKELQIGKAGEYLVCADLILKGFVAYPSEQGLPYDVVLDIDGKLLKVQVKTTTTYRKIPQRHSGMFAYIFNIKRKGKRGQKRYTKEEIDIFALVCLDTMEVGYLPNEEMPDTINIRVEKFRGTYHDEQGVIMAKKCEDMYKTIKNQSEIARILGVDVSTVNQYVRNGFQPFITKARYFCDLKRNKDWFYEKFGNK